ncbi:MAG: hypothetical protein WAL80_15675 [Xanthobacteraceae bacterium]|jgi:hypothetical protein
MHSTLQPSFSELIAPFSPADISAPWRDSALKLQPCGDKKHFAVLLDWTLWRLTEGAIAPFPLATASVNGRMGCPDAGQLPPSLSDRISGASASMRA